MLKASLLFFAIVLVSAMSWANGRVITDPSNPLAGQYDCPDGEGVSPLTQAGALDVSQPKQCTCLLTASGCHLPELTHNPGVAARWIEGLPDDSLTLPGKADR